VEYIEIGKQKVIWILKCRENDKEAAGNVLMEFHDETKQYTWLLR
jgi:hypothetical protein